MTFQEQILQGIPSELPAKENIQRMPTELLKEKTFYR